MLFNIKHNMYCCISMPFSLNRSSIHLDESTKEFYITSNQNDLGKSVHIMLQTILSISDVEIQYECR